MNNAYLKGFCSEVYDFQGKAPSDDLNVTETIEDFLMTLATENNITDNDLDILVDVCTAETEAQALKLDVQNLRAPLGYLALIIIIFAGPLGDKYNRKKPFLLLPMIGELISVLAYLTTSIFKTTVPMQFHLYLETFVNSLCGGFSLMLMGVFSILAATTAEEDRTFRFGVFSAFSSGAGIVLSPLAKYVFEFLGYVSKYIKKLILIKLFYLQNILLDMFLLCILIHVLGIIYIIFFIEEVPSNTPDAKSDVEKEKTVAINKETGLDNPGYDTTTEGSSASTLEMRFRNKSEEIVAKTLPAALPDTMTKETHKNFIRESFDMFISNFKVFSVVRPFSGRMILWLVIIGYSIFAFSNSKSFILVVFRNILNYY